MNFVVFLAAVSARPIRYLSGWTHRAGMGWAGVEPNETVRRGRFVRPGFIAGNLTRERLAGRRCLRENGRVTGRWLAAVVWRFESVRRRVAV